MVASTDSSTSVPRFYRFIPPYVEKKLLDFYQKEKVEASPSWFLSLVVGRPKCSVALGHSCVTAAPLSKEGHSWSFGLICRPFSILLTAWKPISLGMGGNAAPFAGRSYDVAGKFGYSEPVRDLVGKAWTRVGVMPSR